MPTNSASIASERAIPGWIKYGFLATFVFAVCWGGSIAYWRTTRSNPATAELLLYLFGLPACLLVVSFVARKLITRPAAASAATTLPAPSKAVVTPSQSVSLAILTASLRLPHGASPEALAAAIAGGKARSDLDREFVDAEGYPVVTARSSEAVDEALQEEVMEWLGLNGMTELDFSDEQWRAVTLASAVVAEMAAQAVGPMLYQVDTQVKLQLIPILPVEWDAVHRRATSLWLKHTVATYGWPADRVILAADDMTPAAVFKQLIHDLGSTKSPLIAMVVACESHVGEETIARWAADASLFTSSQPQGRIPGEGAAGLLVSNQTSLVESTQIAVLNAVEEAHRDSSADATKRSDSKLLGELSERVLKRGGINAPDVAVLIADTGHRSSRVLELMGYVAAEVPQLEETDDVVRVGVASGTCGAVPFMTALALGRHYVMERDAPVLCISNEDPYRRVVALMRASHLMPKDE
jgi:hypothetical protein